MTTSSHSTSQGGACQVVFCQVRTEDSCPGLFLGGAAEGASQAKLNGSLQAYAYLMEELPELHQ